MVKLVEDFSVDAKMLTMAGRYDHSLTLKMLQKAFLFPLRALYERMETALQEIALKEKGPAQVHMDCEGLLYTGICKAVETVYRRLKDSSEWPPAKHAQDSKALQGRFAAANLGRLSNIQIMTLMQNGFTSGGVKTGVCNHRKKTGHWKRECPEMRGKDGRGGYCNRGGGGRGGCGLGRPSTSRQPTGNKPQPPKGWRFAPLAAGDPAIKTVEGHSKPFKWCDKCKRWMTTHDTATHTGPQPQSQPPPDNGAHANMFLVPDPLSWVFELPIAPLPTPPSEPQVSILRMLLMAMMFGAFITVGCVMDASVVRAYIAGFIQFLVPYGWAAWEYRVY
jgi:hypothetical protein